MKITANSFVPTEAKIIIEGKSYTGNEFNKLVQALRPLSLNDNQQTVLEWLKNQHFDSYVKSVLSNLYFYVNLTAVGDLESKEITAMVAAYEKLSQQEFAQVLQAYANWVLEQEEKR